MPDLTGPDPAATDSLTAQGVFFDGRSSRDHPATLLLDGDQVRVRLGAQAEHHWRADQVTLEAALPGVRRSLSFPDGSRFETPDDAAIRAWEQRHGRNRLLGGVRRLESSWGTALGAVAVTGAVLWAFVTFGVPALARQAAAVTPVGVLATFDRETLQVLEGQNLIGPSELSAARQAQLQAALRDVSGWAGGPYGYRLLLRDGEPAGSSGLGANAFALPNGTVVMTDQLVALARSDRELVGVLAHEAGHVTQRHGLASVYQALGLSLIVTALTGDIVSATTFAAAVPVALVQGGYSRAAETQSDEVAARFMLERYRTTRPLQAILARLEAQDGGPGGVPDLLGTHPGTDARIEHLKQLEDAAR
ncbi:M48 family metallopeptidase [Deinococcus aquaticus]|uniref:M48 family metallopeptidase n=1 Tax=Deinococcus aquaticus TaxID=328692 RepID=A0ABY7V2F1_9DEIO|nr:M48 family metallopeptidase [Deinococcus aquaticus]WDA58136.1 M48 family metallopeptidase [Deinococcus aquaticus]